MKKLFLKISQNSQVFSCEFCEISKSTFSNRTPPVAAPENTEKTHLSCLLKLKMPQ